MRSLWNSMAYAILGASLIVSCKTTEEPKVKSVPPSVSRFDVSPSTATVGDSATVRWEVQAGTDTALTVLLNGKLEAQVNGKTVSQAGQKAFQLSSPGEQTFTLEVRGSDTVLKRVGTVQVSPRPPQPQRIIKYGPEDVSVGPDDGRFTIGCRGQRLTYGYPAPFSTSHIVLRINGSYATNNPWLAKSDTLRTISGTARRSGRIGFSRTEIPLRFHGVDVLQRVVPVNSSFKEITDESAAAYYMAEWTLTNSNSETVDVSLAYLLDTMIDDNDAAKITADNTRVTAETQFTGGAVPNVLDVYRRGFDERELVGRFIVDDQNAEGPTRMIIGRWPYLHSQPWPQYLMDYYYYDSAIMTFWENRQLDNGEVMRCRTYYGTKQGYPIIMIDNDQTVQSQSLTLYYKLGSHVVTTDALTKINELLDGRDVLAASITGFSDAMGTDEKNLKVSKERAKEVADVLKSRGIAQDLIMTKAYGESYALQTIEAVDKGNEMDRRVDIQVWYR